jgi:hypothetical protein
VLGASRGALPRFSLSAPGRVTLSVRRIKQPVNGRAGLNRVRFRPHLKSGVYRLSAGGASARFRVVR